MLGPGDLLWALAIWVGALAGWLDWKQRRVPNWLWIVALVFATPLLLMELLTAPLAGLIRLASSGAFFGIVWFLWRTRAFGGADAKGFGFFSLAMSPVGYYNPYHGKFFPAMDVLVTVILLSEILRRVFQERTMPMFSVAAPPLFLVSVTGGLVWWPIIWLVRLFVN